LGFLTRSDWKKKKLRRFVLLLLFRDAECSQYVNGLEWMVQRHVRKEACGVLAVTDDKKDRGERVGPYWIENNAIGQRLVEIALRRGETITVSKKT